MIPAERPMRPIADYEHRYTALNGFAAAGSSAVFEPVPEEISLGPVVVVSEPDQADYDGPSVTNNIEQIAGEVVMRRAAQLAGRLHRALPARSGARGAGEARRRARDLRPGHFDREDPEPRLVLGRWILELGEPGWQHIERADVELLIGRPLDDDPEGGEHMSNCHHPAVEVVEVGPLQGSYVAHCPDCGAASGEAVTVDQALTDFHARWGADLQEFAGGFFVRPRGPGRRGGEEPMHATRGHRSRCSWRPSRSCAAGAPRPLTAGPRTC